MRQVFTFRENKNKMTKAVLALWIRWAGLVSPSLGLAPPECHSRASLPRGRMHSPQRAVNTQHGTTCPPPRGFPTGSGCPSSSHAGRQAREGPTPNPGFVSRLSPFQHERSRHPPSPALDPRGLPYGVSTCPPRAPRGGRPSTLLVDYREPAVNQASTRPALRLHRPENGVGGPPQPLRGTQDISVGAS